MGSYNRPKKQLHREFIYLDYDKVLNSLSAFEAGKVDEIIHKVSEAREGGVSAELNVKLAKGGGGKKRQSSVEDNLVKTRTWFSAFDSWYNFLKNEEAFGTFSNWDVDVRNELAVGDTVNFRAQLVISPLHKLLRTFLSFAEEAGRQGSAFQQRGSELVETKKNARLITTWMGKKDDPTHLPMYVKPMGVEHPRVVTRLEDRYIIASGDQVEGEFQVVGQINALLEGGDVWPAIRMLNDVPPTNLEIETVANAMDNFVDIGSTFGVKLNADDVNVPAPAVVINPIAVFR